MTAIADDTIFRIGNGDEPNTLDPHLATGDPEVTIIYSLLEGLVSPHPVSETIISPGMAISWGVDETGTVWDFMLRQDALWSNGDSVTASDFVYSWKRAIHPETGSPYARYFHMIKGAKAFNLGEATDFQSVGIKALGPYQFQVILEKPDPHFLKVIQLPCFLPVHQKSIEEVGTAGGRMDSWAQPGTLISNGPFKLVTWFRNSVLRVEKRETYWDSDQINLDAIEFFPISDETTEYRAFQSGFLHMTDRLPIGVRDQVKATQPENIRIEPILGIYFYRLNTNLEPLNDKLVRQALALSIDRELLTQKVLNGGEIAADALVPRNIDGYESPVSLQYSPDKARDLLKAAGFSGGVGFPVMTLLYNSSKNHELISESIQDMWRKELRIDFQLESMDWQSFQETVSSMEFELARGGWIGGSYPLSFLRIHTSDSANGHTGYANARFDGLIQSASHTMDQDIRNGLLMEAEAILLDDLPIIPLFWMSKVFLMSERVTGWHPKQSGVHSWKGVDLRDSDDLKDFDDPAE